jgi:hypothetical protein
MGEDKRIQERSREDTKEQKIKGAREEQEQAEGERATKKVVRENRGLQKTNEGKRESKRRE